MNKTLFIGGGNMASALIGGLLKQGVEPSAIDVVEPWDEQRERLSQAFGVSTVAAPGPVIEGATLVVWAVKPQVFALAAQAARPYLGTVLQLSIMAGVRSDTIARATGGQRVVRSMPNTPALIGRGIAGLHASAAVSADDRARVESVLRSSGELVWVEHESDLDAVTALSGSGPAYVFYFVEAMIQAAVDMGLSSAQGRQLALATFGGAAALAQQSADPPEVLRERVTSKGGTTHAGISALEAAGVKASFIAAIRAAQARARELGQAG